MFGYQPSWDDARRCDSLAAEPLEKLVGSDAICLCYLKARKPIVHTIDGENVYTAWKWSDSNKKWIEMDTWEYSIDARMACFGAMHNKRKDLEKENGDLKRELSNLRMEHELLRHDYERIRPKTVHRFNWLTIVVFIFLVMLCFLPSARAAKPQREVEDQIYDAISGFTKWVYESVVDMFTNHDWLVMMLSYRVTALILGTLTMWKSQRPMLTLIMLVVAYITRYRFVALVAVAYMTPTSTMSLIAVMVMSTAGHSISLYVAVLQMVLSAVLGLVLSDTDYLMLVRGHFAVVCAAITAYLIEISDVPDVAVVIAMVIWRLTVVFSLMGERVEVKDASGKVVKVVTGKPAWLSSHSGFRSFFQKLRTKTSVPVRVMTNSILGIEGEGGLGTGFRVANNIITASHVVGSAEVVRVSWGSSNFTARVVKHLGNDVALLTCPPEAQKVQPFKFPKTISDGTIVVTGINANGDYIVATAEGVILKDQWTYAIQTLDGMSGAPVTNSAGRVVGVHLSNTGFTGGGALLRPEDVHQESEIERLRKEVEELRASREPIVPVEEKPVPRSESKKEERLKKATDQCYECSVADIVNLIRDAVRNEMEVLRGELSKEYGQAKGKTKHKARIARAGKSNRKRVKAWTEEEYRAMQEKGYTREQLQEMAEVILEKMNGPDLLIDEGDYGFPVWDDPDDDDRAEIEKEWFTGDTDYSDDDRQSDHGRDYDQCTIKPDAIHVDSDYNPKTHPWDIYDKYSLSSYYITSKDIDLLGSVLEEYDKYVNEWVMRNLNDKHEWREGIDGVKELKKLAEKRLSVERKLVESGLLPFSQRKKREKRNRTIKQKKTKEAKN